MITKTPRGRAVHRATDGTGRIEGMPIRQVIALLGNDGDRDCFDLWRN